MAFRLLVTVTVLLSLLFSCKGKEEPIPSYVHIDSASIKPSSGQGNRIHDLRFAYAYVDGELLGVFELPATIPVLKEGKHKFTLSPAVQLNGSKNMVAVHTGFLPVDTMLDFQRGKTVTFSNAEYHFRSNVVFPWIEDFEDNSSTVAAIAIPKGDTAFIADAPYELEGRFTGTTKVFQASIQPSDTTKYIDLGSFNSFSNLPNDARDIFLEFDLLCDVPVQLGLNRSNSTANVYVPYLYMYSTEKKWKHFYVNLIYETSGQEAGTTYKILFSSDIGASAQSHLIQLDNIRLSFNN